MKRYLGLFGLVVSLSGPGLLRADTINSQAGLFGVCTWDAGHTACTSSANPTVAIALNSAWQSNNPTNPGGGASDAKWISYANTGQGGTVLAPIFLTTPVWTLKQSFTGNWLQLHVWADDTAEVRVDGVSIILPVLGQNPPCSGSPISCESADFGTISMGFASAGTHTLEFDVYQTGPGGDTVSNPHGLLYTGTSGVPDGGMTLMLLGGALVGLETLRRKFRA